MNRCACGITPGLVFQVYSAETGACHPGRASAGVQRDPAGSLPAHGGCVWELRHPEVLRGKSALPCSSSGVPAVLRCWMSLENPTLRQKSWMTVSAATISSSQAVGSFLLG